MSIFSLYTLGLIQRPSKKSEPSVFQTIDQLKRHVASVNKNINQIGTSEENVVEDSAQTSKENPKKQHVLGEMHMTSGSTVRSLIEANCSFEALEKAVVSSQIKFDFIDCETQGTRMKLINRTNGYEAQIFPNRGKKVSSDFIQLELGANELIFEISSTAGQIKSQVIKIKRIQ